MKYFVHLQSFLVAFFLVCSVFCNAAEPVAVSGQGKLYKIDQLPIVVVEGSWYEMGKQYGTLLKKEMNAFRTLMDVGMASFIGLDNYKKFADLAEEQIQLYPKRFREIHRGMSDGSGLSLRQIAILEHFIAAEIAVGSGLFCSSVTVWDDFTKDGNLIMGRNFDFPKIYSQGFPFFHLAVFRPTDGAAPCATLGYIGSIGSVNMFNAHGLVAEVNVAQNLRAVNGQIHLDRITAAITLTALGFDCENRMQLDAALKTYRFNFPLLCTIADSEEAQTYEIGTRDVVVRQQDEPGLNTVTNWASSPDWEDVQDNAHDTRRANLQSLAQKNKGNFDVDTMKEILNIPVSDGGAMVPMDKSAFVITVHQFIYVPKKQLLSVRQPGYPKNTRWIDIELEPFFQNAPIQEGAK